MLNNIFSLHLDERMYTCNGELTVRALEVNYINLRHNTIVLALYSIV